MLFRLAFFIAAGIVALQIYNSPGDTITDKSKNYYDETIYPAAQRLSDMLNDLIDV